MKKDNEKKQKIHKKINELYEPIRHSRMVEFIEKIAEKSNMPPSVVENFYYTLLEVVVAELIKKSKVNLKDFGIFGVAHRKQKTGINPRTGAKITIGAKNVPVFKPGKALKEMVK